MESSPQPQPAQVQPGEAGQETGTCFSLISFSFQLFLRQGSRQRGPQLLFRKFFSSAHHSTQSASLIYIFPLTSTLAGVYKHKVKVQKQTRNLLCHLRCGWGREVPVIFIYLFCHNMVGTDGQREAWAVGATFLAVSPCLPHERAQPCFRSVFQQFCLPVQELPTQDPEGTKSLLKFTEISKRLFSLTYQIWMVFAILKIL